MAKADDKRKQTVENKVAAKRKAAERVKMTHRYLNDSGMVFSPGRGIQNCAQDAWVVSRVWLVRVASGEILRDSFKFILAFSSEAAARDWVMVNLKLTDFKVLSYTWRELRTCLPVSDVRCVI